MAREALLSLIQTYGDLQLRAGFELDDERSRLIREADQMLEEIELHLEMTEAHFDGVHCDQLLALIRGYGANYNVLGFYQRWDFFSSIQLAWEAVFQKLGEIESCLAVDARPAPISDG